jgi:transcriptional regulator with XRE-family HTH domain
MQGPPRNDQERSIGRRLKEIREVSGMTEAELAARIGQKPSVVEAIESGRRRVTAAELWELCSALNSKPHEFFEGGD